MLKDLDDVREKVSACSPVTQACCLCRHLPTLRRRPAEPTLRPADPVSGLGDPERRDTEGP